MTSELYGGQSRNKISPFGTYVDAFKTERFSLQARIEGQVIVSDTILHPYVLGTHTSDRQKSYTDSLGNLIGTQKVTLKQAAIGLDFATPLSLGQHDWVLSGGFSAIQASTNGTAATGDHDGARGRVHLGVAHQWGENNLISAEAFRDGIGSKGFETTGIELEISFEF